MNSIAPFWDGNETWLVLGGGSLFAAFPVAYAILMPALYLPIMFMLLGLIFRGVAFEFRFKASTDKQKKIWDAAFHAGSLLAAFMQGVILGNIIQGIDVNGRTFSGGALDWANGYSVVTGIALIFGYALLGATWLIMKTTEYTQFWARRAAAYVIVYVALALVMISIAMPFMDQRIKQLWFSLPNFIYLLPIPMLTAMLLLMLWRDLSTTREVRPFLLSIGIFFLGFVGIMISMYPFIIPTEFTIWQAAATAISQTLLLIGVIVFLPVILAYTAYSYYVFRGKTNDKALY